MKKVNQNGWTGHVYRKNALDCDLVVLKIGEVFTVRPLYVNLVKWKTQINDFRWTLAIAYEHISKIYCEWVIRISAFKMQSSTKKSNELWAIDSNRKCILKRCVALSFNRAAYPFTGTLHTRTHQNNTMHAVIRSTYRFVNRNEIERTKFVTTFIYLCCIVHTLHLRSENAKTKHVLCDWSR